MLLWAVATYNFNLAPWAWLLTAAYRWFVQLWMSVKCIGWKYGFSSFCGSTLPPTKSSNHTHANCALRLKTMYLRSNSEFPDLKADRENIVSAPCYNKIYIFFILEIAPYIIKSSQNKYINILNTSLYSPAAINVVLENSCPWFINRKKY